MKSEIKYCDELLTYLETVRVANNYDEIKVYYFTPNAYVIKCLKNGEIVHTAKKKSKKTTKAEFLEAKHYHEHKHERFDFEKVNTTEKDFKNINTAQMSDFFKKDQ